MPQVIVASAKASFSLLQAALAAATTAGVDTAAAHVQWAQLKEQATKHTLEQALSVSNAIADSNAAIEAGGAPVVMGARVRVKPSVTEPKCVAQAPLKAPHAHASSQPPPPACKHVYVPFLITRMHARSQVW